ncbi:MAG: hypothetical protein R2694_01645 [Ilumatobacteraceae bacterium]
MSYFDHDPALLAMLHADRERRLQRIRQQSRLRRPQPGNDDRRWG